MNGFGAFLSKEFVQTLRSSRLWIILGVFLILGLMNAPLAKFTPQILALSGMGDLAESMGMADPVALDAWGQFFSNMGQMGILAILLVCGGTLSGEKSKGTLILPLTKGLGRTGVILIKFLVISLLWTVALLVATISSWAYTIILFPDDTLSNIFLTILLLWLFGEFLLSLIPLSSVLFKGSMSGLIIPGAVLFVLLVMIGFPDLFFWNPVLLVTNTISLVIDSKELLDFLAPILVCVGVIAGSLVVTCLRFRKASL